MSESYYCMWLAYVGHSTSEETEHSALYFINALRSRLPIRAMVCVVMGHHGLATYITLDAGRHLALPLVMEPTATLRL